MLSKDELQLCVVPQSARATSPIIRGKGTNIQWTWRCCREHGSRRVDQGQRREAETPAVRRVYGCSRVLHGRLVLDHGHGANPEQWYAEDRAREWPR